MSFALSNSIDRLILSAANT